MDTDRPTAIGTAPSNFFFRNKLPNAKLLDVFKILDCTHVISGSIPFIHVLDLLAGKTGTLETELQFFLSEDFAVFDSAPADADGFIEVFNPAPGAGVFVPQISRAGSAVHPAGSDKRDCH
jgi:hypothetical protein